MDGTGAKGRRGDVAIKDGRIVAVRSVIRGEATEIVDADGFVVSPGFIDTHTHSDVWLLGAPFHEQAVRQGITTEITGQDGISYAPLSPDNLQMYRRYLAGLNGNPAIDWDWTTVEQYLDRFDQRVAVNVAWQVPHGALRLETLGMVDEPLRGDDLTRAQQLLAEAFEQGAVAFSTGLSYYPCSWADTDELVQLCQIAAAYDRPYVTHIRTVFREPQRDYLRAAVDETLEIGRRSGVKVHFSHFRTGPANAGKVDELLAPIVKAIDEGVDVSLETYPYEYGSGYALYYLPPWVHEGGPDAILNRLRDPAVRARIRDDVERWPFPPHPEET